MTGRKVEGVNEYQFVWVCRERLKGKNGNGCKGRYAREAELLEAFGENVEWVTVIDKGFIKKTGR